MLFQIERNGNCTFFALCSIPADSEAVEKVPTRRTIARFPYAFLHTVTTAEDTLDDRLILY